VSWAVTPGPRRSPFPPIRRRSVAEPEPTAAGMPL